jgi:hypothetical protein
VTSRNDQRIDRPPIAKQSPSCPSWARWSTACPQLRPLRAVSGGCGTADRLRGQVPSCRGHRRSRPPINCRPSFGRRPLLQTRAGRPVLSRVRCGWTDVRWLRHGGDLTNAAVMPQILPSPLRFAAAAWGGVRPDGWGCGRPGCPREPLRPDACPSCARLCPLWTARRPAPGHSRVFRAAARLVEHSAGQVSDSP